jgi:hypothetical protein
MHRLDLATQIASQLDKIRVVGSLGAEVTRT